MTTEFRLTFRGQTEANTLGWINEYRSHPRDATRLVLPAEDFFAQMAAQYPGDAPPVTPPTPVDIMLDVPWESGQVRTHGFTGGKTLALKFTVPLVYASADLSRIAGVEYGGGPVTRFSTLSTAPGDFDITHLRPQCVLSDVAHASFWLQVDGPNGRYPVVQPGQTYYLNVRNTDSAGRPTAGWDEVCDMIFDVTVK